jgi:hypothetical protein
LFRILPSRGGLVARLHSQAGSENKLAYGGAESAEEGIEGLKPSITRQLFLQLTARNRSTHVIPHDHTIEKLHASYQDQKAHKRIQQENSLRCLREIPLPEVLDDRLRRRVWRQNHSPGSSSSSSSSIDRLCGFRRRWRGWCRCRGRGRSIYRSLSSRCHCAADTGAAGSLRGKDDRK